MFTTAKIIEKVNIRNIFWKTKLRLNENIGEAKPFQFIMAGISGEFELPLYVSLYDHENRLLEVFYKVRGEDTKKLSKHNGFVTVRGFYGKDRMISFNSKSILYITEDRGFSVIPFLVDKANRENGTIDIIMIFDSKDEIFQIAELAGVDFKGSVIYIDKEEIDHGFINLGSFVNMFTEQRQRWDVIIGAGNKDLLKAICKLSISYSTNRFLSPFTYVKCGIGACGYCTIPKTRYSLCVDGTLFTCEEISAFLR